MNTIDIYKKFSWDFNDIEKYEKTWSAKHQKDSESSYSFKIEGLKNKDIKKSAREDYNLTCEKIATRLKKEFNISSALFDDKLKMACSGSGEEIQKITALHSSSLCALLFFYNVEECPINNLIEGVSFSQSFFEWRNPVFGNDSNIDVVLYSKEQNLVLFLESKFSEYCQGQSKLEIPYKYATDEISRELYENLCKNLELSTHFEKITIRRNGRDEDVFILESPKETEYLDGLKQMISHYLGVINFLDGKKSAQNNYYPHIEIDDETRFVLGEIIFDDNLQDFYDKRKMSYFSKYQKAYSNLAKILKEDISKRTNKKFEILPEVLCYSELKEHLDNDVQKFYFSNQ